MPGKRTLSAAYQLKSGGIMRCPSRRNAVSRMVIQFHNRIFIMANISVDITELRQILDITPASHNILIVSDHGVGKSQFLTDYYTSRGMKVVPLFLGQMADPGDLLGLPCKDEVSGRTDFMPPYWFPVDGKPVVLFLDEMNRARGEILQTVMDLCLNRKLAGRPLPEGSRVIAAINYGDNYQITDMDPALVSRFDIYNFRPSVEEWLVWAENAGIDARIIDFIQENRLWLDRNADARVGEDTGIDKTPDRRAWARVSDVVSGRPDLGTLEAKIISGIVGSKAASEFMSFSSRRRMVSGKDVLYHLDRVMDTISGYELHELSVVNDGIFRHLEVEKVPAKDKAAVRANIDAYFDFLTGQKKEAAAHFANLYVSQTYTGAVSFLAKECPYLTMGLIQYVKSIR